MSMKQSRVSRTKWLVLVPILRMLHTPMLRNCHTKWPTGSAYVVSRTALDVHVSRSVASRVFHTLASSLNTVARSVLHEFSASLADGRQGDERKRWIVGSR